jgi:hypothetical protein
MGEEYRADGLGVQGKFCAWYTSVYQVQNVVGPNAE